MTESSAALALGRDARIVGLVGSAHFFSHFFQLAIPPLYPVLKDVLGVGYTELGLATMLFYAASGLAQTPSGFLVDRFGPRAVLVGGLALLSGAVALAGLVPGYWALCFALVLAGLGNSVFHPADYALLTSAVHSTRVARAYSLHTVGGNLGWAAAPATVLFLTAAFGSWRLALVALGLTGLAVAAIVFLQTADLAEARRAPIAKSRGKAAAQLLLAPPILLCFAYFTLLSVALIGVQTFLPPSLGALHGTALEVAAAALTAYLLGSSGGVLLGGMAADRFRRHDLIVTVGLLLSAALVLLVGLRDLGDSGIVAAFALAGFFSGTTTPSRDMLVRAATPSGAAGKVFGFVYSGLDLGSAVTPPLLGWFVDHGMPQAVFVFIAAVLLVTIATALTLPAFSRR